MKECIIHAGAHKTGTTSIQGSLASARPELEAAGLFMPRTGIIMPELAAHHNIAFELNRDRRFHPDKGTLEELIREIEHAAPNRILLSSEDFIALARRPRAIRRIESELAAAGYSSTWLFYLRTFPDWIESVYTQLIKAATTDLRFSEWIEKGRRRPLSRPARSLKPFFESGARVVIRSYASAKSGLIPDFYDAVGLPECAPEATPSGSLNLRPTALQMELLRRVASFCMQNDKNRFLNWRMLHARELAKSLPESPRFSALSEELGQSLYQECLPSYRRLLRMAGIDRPVRQFFPPPAPRTAHTFETLDFPPESLAALENAVNVCTNQDPPEPPGRTRPTP